MIVPTASDSQLHFRKLILIRIELCKKELNIVHNAVKNTLFSMAAQHMESTSDALGKSCLRGLLRVMIKPGMCLNPTVILYRVRLERIDGSLSLIQQRLFTKAGRSPLRSDGLDTRARELLTKVGSGTPFLCYSIVGILINFTFNKQLFRIVSVF